MNGCSVFESQVFRGFFALMGKLSKQRLSARVAIHVLAGDAATAQEEIERARGLVEARVRERADDKKDAVGGSIALGGLAEIEARTGHTAEAVKTLQRLLSIPAGLSIQRLKIDPVWDPIRNDPGFQQLLTMKEHVGP